MSLDSAIQHLLNAKRISNPSQSYAKDNPAEWGKVKEYLEGGTRPAGVVTEMGLGLLEVEDERRAVTPPPDPPPPNASLVYFCDFENGSIVSSYPNQPQNNEVMSQQESDPSRIVITPGVVPEHGQWAARIYTGLAQDVGVAGAGGSMRTEIMACTIAQKYGWASLQGKHTWITWDFMYDPDWKWPTDPNVWLLNTQFWSTGTSTGSPVFEINSPLGRQHIGLRGGMTAAGSNFRTHFISNAQVNFLYRWKVHHLWSSGTGGLVEVWRNGVKVVTDTLPNCAVGHEGIPMFKIGTYGGSQGHNQYTVVDNFKFWTADPGPGY